MSRFHINPEEAAEKLAALMAEPDKMQAELARRAARIKPVMMHDKKLHFVANGDGAADDKASGLYSAAFYTQPQPGKAVVGRLDKVMFAHSFMTHHAVIGENVFEPTPVEILLQIPDHLVERACAYEVQGKIGWYQSDRWSGTIALYGLPRIAEISDDELQKRVKSLKPVTRERGKLYGMRLPDLRGTAFTSDPKLTKPVNVSREVAKITTYHTFGYHGMFKPSVAEVLAQVPPEHLGVARYFETNGPESVHDLNRHLQELDEGYHVAETVLYA